MVVNIESTAVPSSSETTDNAAVRQKNKTCILLFLCQ